MLKNAFKKYPLQNRTNVQIKGGGIKGLLNNVQKNCTFLKGWLPLVTPSKKDITASYVRGPKTCPNIFCQKGTQCHYLFLPHLMQALQFVRFCPKYEVLREDILGLYFFYFSKVLIELFFMFIELVPNALTKSAVHHLPYVLWATNFVGHRTLDIFLVLINLSTQCLQSIPS